jgi:hypothetical protein
MMQKRKSKSSFLIKYLFGGRWIEGSLLKLKRPRVIVSIAMISPAFHLNLPNFIRFNIGI